MSRSARRIFVLAVLLIALTAGLAWLNLLWLIAMLAAALAVGLFTLKYRLTPLGRTGFFVVLGAAVAFLYWLGVLPAPLEPRTSTGLELRWIGAILPPANAVHGAGAILPPDPLMARRDRFDSEVLNPDIDSAYFLRSSASWFNSADRFARALQETRPDLEGLRQLEDALNELRPGVKALDQTRIDQFVDGLLSYRSKLYELRDIVAVNSLMEEFEKWYLQNSLGEVDLLRGRLRNVFDAVVDSAGRKALNVTRAYVATFDEREATWILDEEIRLQAAQAAIRRVDLAPLLRMTRPGAAKPEVRLSYMESCTSDRRVEVEAFDTDPVGTACIVLRTKVKTEVDTLDNPLRLASFKGVKLSWPHASPGKIFVTLDLKHEGIPLQYPVSIDIARSEAIKELRLPRYSYFSSSSLPVALESSPRWDVIRPLGAIGLRDLAAVDYHWIELLPESALFRTEWVQANRKYLFPHNLVMLIALAAVGCAFGALFPDTKSSS